MGSSERPSVRSILVGPSASLESSEPGEWSDAPESGVGFFEGKQGHLGTEDQQQLKEWRQSCQGLRSSIYGIGGGEGLKKTGWSDVSRKITCERSTFESRWGKVCHFG